VAYAIIESEFLERCWDAMFQFDTNNFCHHYVEKITSACLELVGGETQVKVFKKTKLVEKLIAAEGNRDKHKSLNVPYLHTVGIF
jgi:hypothetical protein